MASFNAARVSAHPVHPTDSLPGSMTSPLIAVLTAALMLAACAPLPAQRPSPPVTDKAQLHSFRIERAYRLTDPRELAFRDQIAAEARMLCATGDFSLYSSRPVGDEDVRDDFIYRSYDVQITCEG
ncbi:MAG: hypothetical protein ACK4MS_04090 [Paracoccaceae bacterium]